MNSIACLFTFLAVLTAAFGAMQAEFRKQEWLDAHNYLRGAVYPQSSNMLKLKWSDYLANFAASNAIKCKPEHSTSGPILESYYGFWHNNITTIVFYWFMERKVWPNRANLPSSKYGHYETMSRSDVEYVGCAITKTPCKPWKFYIAFCSYQARIDYSNPPGSLFRHGKPCSACPQDVSYCQNRLCVKKKEEGTCQKLCHNCGDLWDWNCRCSCRAAYNYYPDCSVLRDGYSAISSCRCVFSPASRQPCENGGRPKPSDCLSCNCPDTFTGQYCQYSTAELREGAMLVFHWTQISNGWYRSYYPMNVDQEKPILRAIKDIMIRAINSHLSSSIDQSAISVGKGFPFIDGEGIMRTVILVKGASRGSTSAGSAAMPQKDLINALNSVKDQMNAQASRCCGITLSEVKKPSIE